MNSYDELKAACTEFGLVLDNAAINRLQKYAELLVEWNKVMNLTAITDSAEILSKHFYDCLLMFKHFEIPKGASLIDVGTGAGFPGMVLKAVRPDLNITLLDGLQKRLNFLNEVSNSLNLQVTLLHDRAEEAGRKKELREQFDFATARAVAKMQVLSEYCLPFVKVGGMFIALKGPTAAEELASSENALKLLGGNNGETTFENLPDGSARVFVSVKKLHSTKAIYPRHGAKISKQPL